MNRVRKLWLGVVAGVALLVSGCAGMALTQDEGDLIIEQTVMRLIENASDPQRRSLEILDYAAHVEVALGSEAAEVLYGALETQLENVLRSQGWQRSDIALAKRLIERRLPVAFDMPVEMVPVTGEVREHILATMKLVRDTVAEMAEE